MSRPNFLLVQRLESLWSIELNKVIFKKVDPIMVNPAHIRTIHPLSITLENGDTLIGSTMDLAGEEDIHTTTPLEALNKLIGV